VGKLENIGFYTLSDERAKNSSEETPLWRCEMLLTDKCNFNCPYCQPLPEKARGTLPFDEAMRTLKLWVDQGLKHVRFSGGEPMLYKGLEELVIFCRTNGVEKIAISTNGSASLRRYKRLIEAGVNDFSISLDSGCCSIGDKMAGGKAGSWEKVTNNIREISKLAYVTVGMVFTEANMDDAINAIKFASSLGVADIRIISAAQYNRAIKNLQELPQNILDRHPILAYRVRNYKSGRNVRGMCESDCRRCKLVLDDMAVAGGYHFPCIIYMRQNGKPIGKVGPNMRQERMEWFKQHDSMRDPICSSTCLDVCVDFNNKAGE
jgi:molybdenum cofactor biosynthesis enzyme MoaA